MTARMTNPAMLLPGAADAIGRLYQAIHSGGVAPATLELVHLRTSQINGCSACVLAGHTAARKLHESDERLATVVAWQDAPYFTDDERAALALAEATTRLQDDSDPVPDDIWEEAARHFDDKALAALVLMIGLTNLFNRLNRATRQPAGTAWS